MVEKLNRNETPFAAEKNKNLKYSIFSADIEYIIQNRIEYSRLKNFPYADSTSNNDLRYKTRKICRKILRQEGLNPENVDFFEFSKERNSDKYEWYIYFNVTKWENTINNL